jgi:HSP20 family protein
MKDERLILKGARHNTFKTSQEEYVKTERVYGEFYRAIPLPEGAIAEAATAVFTNGVLEIRLPVLPRPEPTTRRVNVEVKPVLEAPTTPSIKQTAAV